ncbi:hypothetical protein FOMA001_g19828 [Fusarium oxysporum f. sp. matthiolae]|nr:hypothetical protein FOMA001_g19828 [Fusarium oxysporum f. sp. matthiolae]
MNVKLTHDRLLLDGVLRKANGVNESENDEHIGEGYEAGDEYEKYEAEEDKPDNEYEADDHEQTIYRAYNQDEDKSEDWYEEYEADEDKPDNEHEANNHKQTICRVENQSGEGKSNEEYRSEASTEFEDEE